jgi:hypothetical protein
MGETTMGGDFFPGFPVLVLLIITTYLLIGHFGAILGGLLSMVAAFFAIVLLISIAYVHGSIERFLKRRDRE